MSYDIKLHSNVENADFFKNVVICEKSATKSQQAGKFGRLSQIKHRCARIFAVEYIIKYGTIFNIEQQTIHVAIYIMDKLSFHVESPFSIELQLLACLSVASKYEDGVGPNIPQIINIAGLKDVTSRMFGDAEFDVIQFVFTIRIYTPLCITNAIIYIADCANEQSIYGSMIDQTVSILSAIAIRSDDMIRNHPPSRLACAIITTARYIHNICPYWIPELSELLGHSEDVIQPVFKHILTRYNNRTKLQSRVPSVRNFTRQRICQYEPQITNSAKINPSTRQKRKSCVEYA